MSELSKYIREKLPFLLKLTQMSEAQEKEVCAKYGFNNVKAQLDKMNNWKKIQNNRNVYQTLVKWFEMDIQRGFFKPETNPVKKIIQINPEKEEFFKNHPVGSAITINGRKFKVETKDFIINENNGFIPISDFINKYKGAL